MPGVFDRLDKEIKVKQQQDGITALDLADLPPALRKIMRLMLRELQMSYPRLLEVMESVPETDRLTRDQLDSALLNLSQQFWLTHIGKGEKAIYKVNLRNKTGST
ncbi:MAG TPA: hypothetical protein PLX90_08285, partial [Anaerolineales bacterium]|nr:hypothetical protein [Anaerolineales bacterium]